MNAKIDIKSAVIGLSVGVLVALGVAAASSPGSVGRYQIAGTSDHALIIDTATGRVWQAFITSNRSDDDFFQPKSDKQN